MLENFLWWCSYIDVFQVHLQDTSNCLCKEVGGQREVRRAEMHTKPPEGAEIEFHTKAIACQSSARLSLQGKLAHRQVSSLCRSSVLSPYHLFCFGNHGETTLPVLSAGTQWHFPSFQHCQIEQLPLIFSLKAKKKKKLRRKFEEDWLVKCLKVDIKNSTLLKKWCCNTLMACTQQERNSCPAMQRLEKDENNLTTKSCQIYCSPASWSTPCSL